MNDARTDFLFAAPSFLSGSARLFDLAGSYDAYNTSSSELEADQRALLADWRVVGQDIFDAIQTYSKSMSAEPSHSEQISGRPEQMSFFP